MCLLLLLLFLFQVLLYLRRVRLQHTIMLQRLREVALQANPGSFAIDDKDGDADNSRDGREYPTGRGQSPFPLEAFVERPAVPRCKAREEVSCKTVAPGRRGGVGPVRGDHVVDAAGVDSVVGHAYEDGEDGGDPPGDIVGTDGGRGVAEEPNGKKSGDCEQC